MGKLLKKLIAITLGTAMAVGFVGGVANSIKYSPLYATDASLSISTYASANSWEDATAYRDITIDSYISVTSVTGGNNGKYYTSNNSWRHYEGNSGAITINASGATLTSTTITYSNGNSGVLKYGGVNKTSGTAVSLSGTSATFSVGHSSGSKNGNVQITAIAVSYTITGGGSSSSESSSSSEAPATYSVTYHDNNKTSGAVPTDANAYEAGDSVTVAGNTGSLARTGYTWSGWSLNSDGSGTAYGPTYTTTYTVETSNIDFYPIWVKDVVPLPESGTFTITGENPTIGSYGTDVPYVMEEDSTPDTEFGFSCTNVMKSTTNLQFKASSGVLYSTTPLQYIRSVVVSGTNSGDATITYGTEPNSGCTNASIGTRSTYFKVANAVSGAKYWQITVTYALEDPASLTGLSIASGLESVKKTYDDGDTFDPTGLVVQAEWNDTLDTEHNVVNDVVWTPNPLTAGTTSVTGTYTHATGTETVTVTGLTVNAPNFVHTYASNSVYNQTSGSSLETRTFKPTTGPEYITLGGYNYSGNGGCMSFMNVAGMYLGNNEEYAISSIKKYVRKIVVKTYENYTSKLKMYEGSSVLPNEDEIIPTVSADNKTLTYVFSENMSFFKLIKSGTTYINLTSIEVFLGSNVPVVDEVVAVIKAGTYYAGATLSASDFDVLVTWTEGKTDTNPTEGFTWVIGDGSSDTLAVGDNSVKVVYQGVESDPFTVVGAPASAQDVIENTITTQTSLSYHYSKNASTVTDSLDRDFTELTGNGYQDWSGKTAASNAVYAGKSYAANNDAIQIRTTGSDCGIVTTTSGGKAKTITVVWNSESTDGKTIDVYGKNTAYLSAADLFSAGTQGTSLGSIVSGTSTSLTISGDYEYIGIRSNNGAVYLDSVDIVWATGYSYDYSNAAIRFGGFISQDLWDELDTNSHNIDGYGVLLTTDSIVGENDDIADAYSLADGTTVIDYYSKNITPTPKSVPTEATSAQKTAHGVDIEDHYYIWNLYFDIDEADFDTTYVAGAYIKLKNGDVVFMKKASFSVYSLAADYIANRGYNASEAGGSLGDLASHA